jgi:DNA repair protein RadC
VSYHPQALPALRIRELPASERPLARLQQYGPGALSDAELLALVLQAESLDLAQRLLVDLAGWAGLQRAALAELQRVTGVGPMRAAQLKAAIEIGRRLIVTSGDERLQITQPADAAHFLMLDMASLEQEHLRVLCLNTKNRLQKIQTVYIGSVNMAQVRVGELFREPVRLNSTSIIICHNHPSGDPSPSPDDVALTRAIVQAGQLLDIDVLDHLIIGQGHWVSLRERGLGFDQR